ncbi:MAG TPA: hypothetical protein VIV58_16315 [Kofleriaceae bacterium]
MILGLVLSCSQPHVDPKTGDVVATCAPAGGPKPDVPVQPVPAPEPEKPPVAVKGPEGAHRDQPCPGDKVKPDPKTDTASNDKPSDKSGDKPAG